MLHKYYRLINKAIKLLTAEEKHSVNIYSYVMQTEKAVKKKNWKKLSLLIIYSCKVDSSVLELQLHSVKV